MIQAIAVDSDVVKAFCPVPRDNSTPFRGVLALPVFAPSDVFQRTLTPHRLAKIAVNQVPGGFEGFGRCKLESNQAHNQKCQIVVNQLFGIFHFLIFPKNSRTNFATAPFGA